MRCRASLLWRLSYTKQLSQNPLYENTVACEERQRDVTSTKRWGTIGHAHYPTCMVIHPAQETRIQCSVAEHIHELHI